MKIKNIQEYRSFYKNEVRRLRLEDRNENFIGNFLSTSDSNEVEFGWFEIYHGDKEGYGRAEAGIENFLQSFLDMAKDGQAVYEFLQNAVDAGSTHYAMVWGEDELDGNHYVLVANNGKMFNLDSVRSILNVGSSTKSNDSQTIGKFGIGFKLAHRLVGKDNGLQELINEQSGPILFSWKNYEIEQLANEEAVEPEPFIYNAKANRNFEIIDHHPWLFKILITCFPCLPENRLVEELPKMADGQPAKGNPFSDEEYHVLSRWVKKYQHILNKDNYNEGALFFIKLGKGKEEELAEVNLKEGVKFSLAILKETATDEEQKEKLLHTVQLNDNEPITYPELQYIKLNISKEKDNDTYAYIRFGIERYKDLSNEQQRKMTDEADIEALFGFRKHYEIGEYFKGAPNLYLYFPLSEEVHNFNYILHSNAFYKGSSRTFLHKGNTKEDGINERLLKVLVNKIDEQLKELSQSENPDDKSLFLHFYASLLTSGKSNSQPRLWIETPYIAPVNDRLKQYIPICNNIIDNNYKTVSDNHVVFIKKTEIDIDPDVWGLQDVNWFYWNEESVNIILKGIEKLGIKNYTIFDLLEIVGIEDQINNWLGGNEDRIKLVLSELSSITPDKALIDGIKPQLVRLKLLRFSNGELLSISEFLEKERNGYFLLHNTLGTIKDILQKVGLITTELDLKEFEFVEKYRTFLLQSSKHSGYTELTKLFSQSVEDQKLTKIRKDEKLKIFNAFRTFNTDNVNERIRELKLFENNLGKPIVFKSLLSPQPGNWLNLFAISSKEYDEQVKAYLLDDRKFIYEQIVYPYWEDILNLIGNNRKEVTSIFEDIISLFNESSWSEKQQHSLSNQDLILFKGHVVKSDNIFYKSILATLSEESFSKVQDIAFKIYGLQIPDSILIKHLDNTPLSYSSILANLSIDVENISINDVNDLLLFCIVCDIDFFEHNTISYDGTSYSINYGSKLKQYYASDRRIVDYIGRYHSEEFILIPTIIQVKAGAIKMSGTVLIERLVDLFSEETMEQELDLIELVLNERKEDKKQLLNSLTYLRLDALWKDEHQNELYLKLIDAVIEDTLETDIFQALQQKLIIYNGEQEVNVGEIESAQDAIEVKRGDKVIYLSQSQILDLENSQIINLVQHFHDEALNRSLISSTKAHKLFKISSVGITNDLINRFENVLKSLNLLKDALPITNSHQLAFVLLSNKYASSDLKKFAVKCHDNKWYFLKGQRVIFSTENEAHIHETHLLNAQYVDLQSVFSLGDFEVFNYSENEDDIIASKFLFFKGIDPEILSPDSKLLDKLNYLYDGWKGISSATRDYKKDAEWKGILGINPSHYVLNGKHIESEILPDDFLKWCKDEKSKQEFLRSIGVFVKDRFLEPLRNYLLKDTETFPEEVDPLKFNDTILLNTLKGLCGNFNSLNNQPIIYDIGKDNFRILMLERIITHLTESDVECPLLVHNDSISFKVINFSDTKIWQIEDELHSKLKQNDQNNLNHVYSSYYIIKSELLSIQKLNDLTDQFKFNREFTPTNTEEHDEPFYHNWSKHHKIILIKQDELKFKLFDSDEGKGIRIGTIADGNFHIVDDGELTTIFYPKSIYLEGLKSALEESESSITALIEDLISRRDAMLASIYNAYNAANIDDVNSEHLQALQDAFKAQNLKQERNNLIDNIRQNAKYSYDWFISYLDYLLTFSNNTSDNDKQKTIRFESIKRQIVNHLISGKYFLLSGASSYVSDSIEEASDFSLSITMNNYKRVDVIVEGAQKQGQDLLIFCPKGIPNDITENLDAVFQAEITFVPQIDLLKELRSAFANENNLERWDQISESLPSLHFIYGPPGTGKTTTLCERIIDIKEENSKTKILFLTPTNKAADVLSKKLLMPSNDPNDKVGKRLKKLIENNGNLTITRIGRPTDPELEDLDTEVYQSSVNDSVLRSSDVLAMTIHRLPYTTVFTEELNNEIILFKLEEHWDYVIFDEASMINLPYLVFATMAISRFSPNVKFIIAGDPKQIPPVVDVNDKELEELDIQDENVYSMMNIRSFNKDKQSLRNGDSIQNLNMQYRSIGKIGKLFSELSYGGLLQHYREKTENKPKDLPSGLQKLISNNVLFIDIPLNNEDSVYKIRQLFYSSYHIYSAILVSEIIKFFDAALSEDDSWSLGLIAPYKAQAVMMNKLIASFGISEKIKIYADTVHGFQGDECDLVFFISNPNNYYYTGHPKSLLSKEYIYNVAISRAKDYLVVLHPFSEISNNTFINRIKNSYRNNYEIPLIKKASEIESILFKEDDFIYNNSYITGHDTINVFGQLEKKYFIKANPSAVDIQLRKLSGEDHN
ncbi:AAA domain-containing protein [Chryseobacterium sp. sg2396]|uniref:AAA domain-containing protein n=1 Tax=Chryseobacterium sp. sg2396 TaxID=3276280 RepID=UPI00366F2295